MGGMTIGQLAACTGLSVRTLRFYADAGVLPEAGRTEAGYRLFAADAVARARLVRTLRELGVGLKTSNGCSPQRSHLLSLPPHTRARSMLRSARCGYSGRSSARSPDPPNRRSSS